MAKKHRVKKLNRPKTRKLVRWNESLNNQLILYLRYTMNKEGMEIPWGKIGAAMPQDISASAIVQHLDKLRLRMARQKIEVPGVLGRRSTKSISTSTAPDRKIAGAPASTSTQLPPEDDVGMTEVADNHESGSSAIVSPGGKVTKGGTGTKKSSSNAKSTDKSQDGSMSSDSEWGVPRGPRSKSNKKKAGIKRNQVSEHASDNEESVAAVKRQRGDRYVDYTVQSLESEQDDYSENESLDEPISATSNSRVGADMPWNMLSPDDGSEEVSVDTASTPDEASMDKPTKVVILKYAKGNPELHDHETELAAEDKSVKYVAGIEPSLISTAGTYDSSDVAHDWSIHSMPGATFLDPSSTMPYEDGYPIPNVGPIPASDTFDLHAGLPALQYDHNAEWVGGSSYPLDVPPTYQDHRELPLTTNNLMSNDFMLNTAVSHDVFFRGTGLSNGYGQSGLYNSHQLADNFHAGANASIPDTSFGILGENRTNELGAQSELYPWDIGIGNI